MLQLVIGKRVGAITFVALTSNGGGKRRKLKNHDELGLSSLPSTFPRVTKLANSIRASISSIVLDTQRGNATAELEVPSAKRKRRMIVCAHRVFISLAHVISLRAGAFKQAPMIPRISATRDSKTILRLKENSESVYKK
jgi:hypothetical protein